MTTLRIVLLAELVTPLVLTLGVLCRRHRGDGGAGRYFSERAGKPCADPFRA